MLVNALVMASVTYIGFMLIYIKLPRWMRKLIYYFPLIPDLSAAVLTYVIMGGTATALIAAALVGIMFSVTLKFNPDGFGKEKKQPKKMK